MKVRGSAGMTVELHFSSFHHQNIGIGGFRVLSLSTMPYVYPIYKLRITYGRLCYHLTFDFAIYYLMLIMSFPPSNFAFTRKRIIGKERLPRYCFILRRIVVSLDWIERGGRGRGEVTLILDNDTNKKKKNNK